jgi:hypothetical protein
MNINFVTIIKRIIAEQGEDILANPKRVKGYINDYAARESKVERLVFCRCIEHGAYTELKNAPNTDARLRVKAALAQKVNGNEGLELALCNDVLDALDAGMFGTPTTQTQTVLSEAMAFNKKAPSIPQRAVPPEAAITALGKRRLEFALGCLPWILVFVIGIMIVIATQ